MAYSGKNRLQRIIDIQNITLEHLKKGVSQDFIFWQYIHPTYKISRRCYTNYMGINAKAELKKLLAKEEAAKQQLKLFNN